MKILENLVFGESKRAFEQKPFFSFVLNVRTNRTVSLPFFLKF